MTINAPFGSNLYSLLRQYKASFIWDPVHPTLALGAGSQGSSGVECTLQDIDSVTGNEPYCVWSSANDRFEVIYPDTTPDKILGDIGEFSDGKYTSYWWAQWDATNLGFSVTSPTTSGALGQVTGTSPDIYYHTSMPDVTYVETDGEAQDAVIERSQSKSSTWDRTFQIFVKSLDGEDPTGKVKVGFNSSAGTRTVADTVWCRQLPGSRDWWAIISHCPSDGVTTTNYITMSFAQNTGRWYLAAPNWYNTYSTFENIVRSPVPRIDSNYYSRGQHSVYTTNLDFAIPVSGWLAMSMILPDKSVSQGHQHYDGTSEYNFAGIYSWASGYYTLRAYMSSTHNEVRFILDYDDGVTSDIVFALGIGNNWNEFEAVGIVLTWGISIGSEFAYLYVNGEKEASVFGRAYWMSQNLSPSAIYIGSDGSGGSAADLWIPRFAIGRSPLHRTQARILSAKMRQYTRTGNTGPMSQIT